MTEPGCREDFMDYEKEIHRLKVKCNSYAKRLVNEGFDDVEWEVTNGPYSLFYAPGNAQQTNPEEKTMDDMIRGLASLVSKYTEMSMKAWAATPEECKEMLTMGFPLVQGTHMQLIIDKIAKMPWDHLKAGEQLKDYSESGAASNNGFNLTRQ